MSKKILAVIGGGAAGFFCAINAARLNPHLEVIIIEKTNKLLSKVKVSGGGRCNVTHACFSIAEMIKKYPRGASFLKKAFHHFFTTNTIHWFKERGVELKTEDDGRMFPVSDTSQTILDCLITEANKYNVKILMNREVVACSRQLPESTGHWEICFKDAAAIYADYICAAAGGYPSSSRFEWLKKTGHTIEEPVPSLFTFNIPHNTITALMGVSIPDVKIKIAGYKTESRGPLLITHWGLSGPAILKLSAWAARDLALCNWHFAIIINWVPLFNENSIREKFQQLRFDLASQKMINRNPFSLPQRFWEYLLVTSGVDTTLRWADLPAKDQNRLIKNLCVQEFVIHGKTTFKEEFVTCGGIKLSEIDANSMKSKLVPNLFFAGEILDIDGITGGFNFQNAWTTGWIAAKSIAESSSN
jgi:predicted Rossmann fold flavoprotein